MRNPVKVITGRTLPLRAVIFAGLVRPVRYSRSRCAQSAGPDGRWIAGPSNQGSTKIRGVKVADIDG